MRLSHKRLIWIGGIAWLAVGIFLLTVGVKRLQHTVRDLQCGLTDGHPLGNWLQGQVGSPGNAAVVMLAVALGLGLVKGRFALAKAMRRLLCKIDGLPDPAPVSQVYGAGYLALVVGMIALGALLRVIGVAEEVRGIILTAVGFALARASLGAFRALNRSAMIGGPRQDL
jgi:hypothetical protein